MQLIGGWTLLAQTGPPGEGMEISEATTDPLFWLVASAVITGLFWQFRWGRLVLYPFSILATWFHEMAHGVTGQLLGAQFEQLELYKSGSGLARYRHPANFPRWRQATIAAAGPLGPPVAGAAMILAGTDSTWASWALILLGVALLVSAAIWVRSAFGWTMLGLLGVAAIGIGRLGWPDLQAFSAQFVGVQACVSTYRQLGYLFQSQATVGGQTVPSDSGQIAQALWLPAWFWGTIMAGASLGLLGVSLWIACR